MLWNYSSFEKLDKYISNSNHQIHFSWLQFTVHSYIFFFLNTTKMACTIHRTRFTLPSSIKIVALLISVTSSWVPGVQGERILFLLPLSSKSMANIFEPLAKSLAEKGHQLNIVSPVSFKIKSENVTEMLPVVVDDFINDYPNPFEIRRNSELYYFPVPYQKKYCYKLFDKKAFADLANQKFDLVIVNILFHDCFAGIIHKIGSPIIFVGSLPVPSPMTELLGTHLPSSFLPIFALGDISAQLTFTQRTKNFLYNTYYSVMMNIQTRPHLEVWYRERLGQDIPSIIDIYKKQGSMILMNSHFALTNPRPYLPNIIEIGGVHCRQSKPLPKVCVFKKLH